MVTMSNSDTDSAQGKRIMLVGFRENVFNYLPEVKFFPTWHDALNMLRQEQQPTRLAA